MSQMYRLIATTNFERKYRKYTNKDKNLAIRIGNILDQIKTNPKSQALKTHKVYAIGYGQAFSSRINKNLRIIWNFEGNDLIILLLNLGEHSVKNKVYK